ncbi:MAG: DEAD/DEAH box helicase [Candidatus Zixiibacteriota bacterium]|nr:DEAD/DEAH box helicase [candidate division Zixibacteria bacterium]MBU1469145.1 DEAD/DEAH box helicase [candidate division Zixibacteria bacterium]
MTDRKTQSSHSGFTGLGIAPGLLDAIDRLKFTEPTPIQRQSIPITIEGKDLIAIAQTGTGKTLAYGIPMIQRLAQIKGRGLVLAPTRELALQVDEALNSVGRSLGLRTTVLIGGASMAVQLRSLERKPRVIVATPGRLIDHLEHRKVSLADVQILVLDEADRMLDMGFAPQINRILADVPKKRQMMLFSATIPEEIMTLARREMEFPIHVEVAPSGTAPEKIIQEMFFIERGAKTQLLEVMLNRYLGPVLIFTRTKHGARKLARQVRSMGHTAADIHSDRSLSQRREALDGFKSGKYRVLVATDVAARGLDVSGIELVVNYDLPTNTEDYVHRIGRTGRVGLPGRSVSFATLDQKKDVRSIERLIRTDLPISVLPDLPPPRRRMPATDSPDRSRPPRRQPSAQRPSRKPPRQRRQSSRKSRKGWKREK